jgi:hypothetical protein
LEFIASRVASSGSQTFTHLIQQDRSTIRKNLSCRPLQHSLLLRYFFSKKSCCTSSLVYYNQEQILSSENFDWFVRRQVIFVFLDIKVELILGQPVYILLEQIPLKIKIKCINRAIIRVQILETFKEKDNVQIIV